MCTGSWRTIALIDGTASPMPFTDIVDFAAPVAVLGDGTDTATMTGTADRIDIRFDPGGPAPAAPRSGGGAMRGLFTHVGLVIGAVIVAG